jgi:ferritin-like metal-binding protein YciE
VFLLFPRFQAATFLLIKRGPPLRPNRREPGPHSDRVLRKVCKLIRESPNLNFHSRVHRKETEGQIERLQQCFQLLGEESQETECHGIRGLIAEKKAFSEEDPSEDLIDVFNVGAAIKTESYEICEYESLIDMAREMKHTKVAQLLSQNLKEEKATLKKMEAFSERVKPKEMMNEEQEAKTAANEKTSRRKRAA